MPRAIACAYRHANLNKPAFGNSGMARIRALLIFTLLVAASISVFAGYREQMEARVLSTDGYPVQGAELYVEYEISQSRGEFITGPKITNSSGRAYFDFSNSEYNEEDTNKDYTVIAKFGESENAAKFTLGIGDYPRTVVVAAYPVYINLKDKDGNPISVPIEVAGLKKTTDAWGNALFILPPGNHTAIASYKGVERKQSFDVMGKTELNMSVKLYNLTVKTVDDEGNPISADVYVDAQQKTADYTEGFAHFEDILDPQPSVSAYWGRFKKVVLVNLDVDNVVVAYFDTHPPGIGEIEANWKDRYLQVRTSVDDNATYASGMQEGQASVKLVYTTLSGGEREVPMYSIGYNFYEGLIPVSGAEAQIRYSIVAQDADGNRKTSSDIFVLPTSPDGGGSRQITEPPEIPSISQPDQSMLIIVGIGILVIIAGVTFHYYQEHLTVGKPGQPPLPPMPPK